VKGYDGEAVGVIDVWPSKLDWSYALILGAAFFWLSYLFFTHTAEDAYIVARYVNNLLAGKGLVYNEGERINALTSAAHTFLLAGLRSFVTDAVLVYKAIMLGALPVILYGVGRRVFKNRWSVLFYLSLTLLSPFVVLWAVGGMETPILLFILSTISGLTLQSNHPSSRTAAWVILLSALAFLTRYDSAVFLVPVVGKLLWDHRRSSSVWVSFGISSLVVLVWLSFTLMYYHDLLPTSFYTKSPLFQTSQSLLRGLLYLASFLVASLTFLPLFSKRPLIQAGTPSTPAGSDGVTTGVLIGLFLFGGYAILAGTKHMMYAYRLYVPFIPTLILVLLKLGSLSVFANARGKRLLFLAIVAYQCGLGYVVNEFSINANVTLLLKRQDPYNEYFEFSTFGAKYSIEALKIYHQGAIETKEHWRARGGSVDSIPRMYILPGGMLPYSYPELYVYETLASYRHRCTYDFKTTAHYLYLIYPTEKADTPSQVFGNDLPKWQRISSHLLAARGISESLPIRFEIYFQEAPARNKLPPRIDQPCLGN
jgi:hypothetical protein